MRTQLYKQTFYDDGNLVLEYEVYAGYAYMHSTIKSWKLSVYKTGCRVLNSFLTHTKEAGLKGVYTISPNPRYCELFGGKYVNSITVEGKQYEVFKWELK